MKKKVIIIGAGFAGLSVLLGLLKKKELFDIKIIEKDDCFEYTPSLHLCIGNQNYVKKIKLDLKKYYNEFFVKDNIKEIKKSIVIGVKKNYNFDYLVIATGSRTNFYNKKDFETNTYPFKRTKDIELINSKLKKHQNIVVVGGGYTGVEITGILAEKHQFNVTLINAGNHLLNNINHGEKIQEVLEKNNVKIINGKNVSVCNKKLIVLESGEKIKTDLTILSAGITLNELTDSKLNNDLSLKNNKNIFLCGDVAKTGNLSTAHNAMIEGRFVASNIISRVIKTRVIKKKENWKILAVALGENKGLITFGEKNVYIPFTGFLKWIIEKRILFEFKYRIRLAV